MTLHLSDLIKIPLDDRLQIIEQMLIDLSMPVKDEKAESALFWLQNFGTNQIVNF